MENRQRPSRGKLLDVEFFGNPKPSRVIRRMKVATAHFAEEAI